ncbi:MAG: CARDB domain-containing protein [Phycisphaerae bacterium]
MLVVNFEAINIAQTQYNRNFGKNPVFLGVKNMCKRVVLLLLVVAVALVFGYSGGDGTEADPWQISTAEDYNTLATTPADWSNHFLLTRPIDLSAYPDLSIGTAVTPFTGSFNGGDIESKFPTMDGRKIAVSGNSISGYSLTGNGSRLGMFGFLGAGAVVKNVFLMNPIITGGAASDRVGAICGESNAASILNCTVLNDLGPLSTAVNVLGDDAGGICGYASTSTISGCYSNLNVQSDTEVGGIAGYIRTGTTLSNSVSDGTVVSTNTINSKVGGIVGNSSGAVIENCYSLAAVSGSKTVGGFVGINAGDITNCYAAGSVSYMLTYAGGFAGYLTSGPITGSFYGTDGGLDGIGAGATSSGLTGKTSAELQLYSTYSAAGYDFDSTWLIVDAKDFPRLEGVGVQPMELPNLIVAADETEQSVYTGRQVTVSYQETNNGIEVADYHNTHLFYSRIDEGWDELVGIKGSFGSAEDPNGLFGEIALNSVSQEMSIGASHSDSFTFTVPDFATVLYFRVYTDANDEIPELSEADNWSETIAVTINTIAELTATLQPAQSTEDPSTDVTLTATVSNSGTGDAGEFAVNLYRSSEPVEDWVLAISNQTATLQQSKTVTSLASGATANVDFTVISFGGAGDDYYAVWVDYDDVVVEIDNMNNISGSSQITVEPQVELAVAAAPETLGDVAVGDNLAFSATISNVGDGSAGAFSVALEFSADGSGWTAAAVEAVSDIAPAGTAQVSFDFAPALAAGTYQTRLVVDSEAVIDELDETNNITSLGTITMLDKADIYFVSTPASLGTVQLGEDVSVDVTLGNEGDIAAGAFTLSLQLSEDGISWNSVATAAVSGLAADGTISKTIIYTANADEGSYQARVVADYTQALDETDRADNIQTTGMLTVEVAVDLVVTGADTLGTVYINDTVDCHATIENIGTATAGSFDVALVLSPNGTNWFSAATESVTALAAGASAAVDFSFETTSVGAYQAKIRVNSNSAVVESNPNNNELAAGTLSVINKLDVSCSLPSFAYAPTPDVMAGEQVYLPLKIFNTGTDTVNNVVTALLISETTDFAGADTVAQYTAAYVFPSVEASGSFTFTAQAEGGTYYLRALTDSPNSIVETDETNNYSADTITLDVTPSIDLSASDYPTDGVVAYLGGKMSVHATVVNSGISNSGNFSVSLYKADASDAVWASLTPVQTKTVFSLAKDATADVSFEFDVTETEAASLFLNIMVDSAEAVTETSEANNFTGAFALTISEKYSGGLGTESAPYLISTAADLAQMAASPEDMDKYFLQTADVTAGALTPIAGVLSQFEGEYDGAGFEISGLVSSAPNAGLFEYIKAGGVVKNVLVIDADVSATFNAGIIASVNRGTISGCFTSGSVSGIQAGGIAYLNWGTIENCYTTAAVNASGFGGGITADSNNATLTNCYAAGVVSGSTKGALVAIANGATVTGCFWNAQLSGVSQSGAGEEKTLAEMCSADTFTAWDAAIWRTGSGLLPTFTGRDMPEADITVSTTETAETAFKGAAVEVDFTLANAGSSALGAFDTVLLLSTDAGFASSEQVDSAATAGLTAGSDDAVTLGFDTTSYAAGTYYLKAVADSADAVTETDEANESAVVTLTLNAGIDLTATYNGGSLSDHTTVAESVTVTVTNDGLDASGDFNVSLLYANDTAVAPAQTISLTGGESREVTFNFTTPATAGSYPLRAVVDSVDAVLESDESNQTANISLTVVNSPDLTASVSTAGVNAYDGVDFSVSVTVSNDGLASAGASSVELYYSSTDDFSGAASYGSKPVSSINAGADRSVSFTVNLAEGAYYFWAKADSTDVVYEHNADGNNVSASAHAVVKANYDLTISIDEAELSSYFSETAEVNVTIANAGTSQAGASTAKLYLEGAEVDSADIAAGQTAASFSFTAPAEPGTYSLIAKIDTEDVIDESSETNNTSAGITLTVKPRIDLAISFFSDAVRAPVGADTAALFAVTNTGNGTAAASQAMLLVNSADSDWGTQALEVVGVDVPALAAGETFNGSFSFAASVDGGRFYLKAECDYAGAVEESDEVHNNETAVITFDSEYAFSGGLGTFKFPYLLSTPLDIADLASTNAQMGEWYKLTCDIDMAGVDAGSIGSADAPFTGVFIGNYHTISNFTLIASGTGAVALFGATDSATIDNLGVVDPVLFGDSAAGIAGSAVNTAFSNCYVAGGSITGADKAAGFIADAQDVNVVNCYSATMVADASLIRGFIATASSDNTIEMCYASTAKSGGDYFVPFAPLTSQASANCFYNSDNGTGGAGTALTGAQMVETAHFTDAGWSFVTAWAMGESAPELIWQNGIAGLGTADSPYIIRTAENLVAVSQDPNYWDSNILLDADIDLTGIDIDPIGTISTSFTGHFDGAYHTISGYSVECERYCGLFGINEGLIESLVMSNVNLSGVGGIGGICGYNDGGTIKNCSISDVEININGDDACAGAIVSENNGVVEACYASGNVIVGPDADLTTVGLITGYNLGDIAYCYAVGDMSAAGVACFEGMLVGVNGGVLRDSYSVGAVTDESGWNSCGAVIGADLVDNPAIAYGCVFDSAYMTTGVGNGSIAGTFGRSAAEMALLGTYTDLSWNTAYWFFVSDNYPILEWEAGESLGRLFDIADNWLSEAPEAGDLNDDGKVDLEDYAIAEALYDGQLN